MADYAISYSYKTFEMIKYSLAVLKDLQAVI